MKVNRNTKDNEVKKERSEQTALNQSGPSSTPPAENAVGDLWYGAPEPHPLNFDWYFDDSSVQKLLPRLAKFRSVLCLGCPKVFVGLQQLGGLRSVLIDINEPLVDFLRSRTALGNAVLPGDLRKPLPEHLHNQFEAVVLDPPWYVPFYLSWLQRASEALSKDGVVFLSLFPSNIRPSGDEERNAIIKAMRGNGLKLRRSPEFFLYEHPPFELAMFRNKPALARPKWSDLVRAQTDGVRPSYASGDVEQPELDFITYQINAKVIKLRKSLLLDRSFPIHLDSPYDDGTFWLKSLSRRDRNRAMIDLWISDGRVYRVKGGGILSEILKGLHRGTPNTELVQYLAEQHGISKTEAAKALTAITVSL